HSRTENQKETGLCYGSRTFDSDINRPAALFIIAFSHSVNIYLGQPVDACMCNRYQYDGLEKQPGFTACCVCSNDTAHLYPEYVLWVLYRNKSKAQDHRSVRPICPSGPCCSNEQEP